MNPNQLAPWEQAATPSGFTLVEAARRLGHYAWAEMRTFETLGSWTHTIPEPAVAAVVGAHANQHAWHAELWHQRFPELREWDRSEMIRPGSDGLVAFFDDVAARESTLDRLVAAYRVLIPHLVATYSYHRNRCSPVSDGPTLRSLGFVLADDTEQHSTGTLILASTITAAAVAAAGSTQSELETRLVEAGGIAGAGTIPPTL